MQHIPLITEEKLHLHSDFAESRGLIPELLFRLISASIPNPNDLRLAIGGSIGQRGWDGVLVSPISFDPYVSSGQSFWEIGVGSDPKDKATKEFDKRTAGISPEERTSSTFVFVTSRSAYHAWSSDDQRDWIKQNKSATDWRDIRIIDGSKLIQWLYLFPGIDFWLAERLGIPTKGLSIPACQWEVLQGYGSPPPLKPEVFLTGREQAFAQVLKLFQGETVELRLETRYPEEGVDFVTAVLSSLEPNKQFAYSGRCLIIDDATTWKAMCNLQTPHVFIGTPSLDLDGSGADLRQQARTYKHSVIFTGTPLAAPHGNAVRLAEAKPSDMEKALVSCGYPPERARLVSSKSGGRTTILKRLLLDLSASPNWAGQSEAAELCLAALIGRWDGSNAGDKDALERYLGKAYGEWIGTIRPMTLRPDPPLIQRDEKWRFVSRFEGWQLLGPYLSNEDLDRFRQLALEVLKENDPKFDLEVNERWMANVHGKVRRYSNLLREGLAETLALLGSFPESLSSCSVGKPRGTAEITVRETLSSAHWKLWASLQDVLPLLAEASPEEFLDVIEHDLDSPEPGLFGLFAQETSGIGGWNYMTGLLWALETLAWNAEYLIRVTLILGRLAERDPGGNWANRPSNSLGTIFLPWFPQTCAPVEKRRSALELLLRETPQIGWELLLGLLPPSSRQMSMGSRKPAWREWIPNERKEGVSGPEYWQQLDQYASLVILIASSDLSKLAELTGHLDRLQPPARDQVLQLLSSEKVCSLPEKDRFPIWQSLVNLVGTHRMFSDATWAMPEEVVSKIEEVANTLTPESPECRYQRLFGVRESDLMEKGNNYEEQRKKLEQRRQDAVSEVISSSGMEGLFQLAQTVEAPWKVGFSLGVIASAEVDTEILPTLLTSQNKSLSQFGGGYVWGRFSTKAWSWVLNVPCQSWDSQEKSAFLALLPFEKSSWDLAEKLLGGEQIEYWNRAPANPYDCDPAHLPEAIERLLSVNRAAAALPCLAYAVREKMPIEPGLAVQLLDQLVKVEQSAMSMEVHDCREIIRWLQDNPTMDKTALQRIEWAYLPLLDGYNGATPRALERQLATDPAFFCEVIRTIFRSKQQESPLQSSEQEKLVAERAYKLLSEWWTLPGTRGDGTVDALELNRWLDAVKESCKQSGHLEIALSRIGHVLAHAREDPDGTWICHPVADVLNAAEAEDLRHGFMLEKLNSRGVHTWTKGQAEREIAFENKKMAEAIEHLYPRLAATMRKLAKWYEEDAEKEAARDPFEE